MAIGDDFSVAVNGNIRHDSGSTNYTVLELHRWLQDLADDAAAGGNDLIDITSGTPSERSTDQIITLNSPYNIDDDAAQYLYGGSITQAGGNTQYSGVAVVGAVYDETTLQIVQDNALYDGDSPFWGTTDETYAGYNGDAGTATLMRVMVKSRDAGSDVDGKRIRVTAREWGHTWAEFGVTLGLGEAVAAIFTNQDLNNATASGTVAGWTGITVPSTGYQGQDLGNGNGTKYYLDLWNTNQPTRSINDFYERMKYLARRGTSETIHGMDGELYRGITHQWDYDNESGGPFTEDETLTWTGGGEAVLLALDDNGATGTMWVQLTKGSAPGDGVSITGGTSSATCDTNGAATARSVSPVFIGQSTGSAIIGAFGVGIESDDLTNADKITALDNTLQTPPNNVTFSVAGLVSGEDYVLLTPESGGGIDTTQMQLATALTGASETVVDVGTGNIPSGIPQTGVLRIVLDDGRHRRVPYLSHDGDDEFTIASTDFSGSNNAAISQGVYQGMIDTLASGTTETYTQIYNSDVPVFVRIRDGGGTPIKTFEVTGTIGSAGGSATAIRTSDA